MKTIDTDGIARWSRLVGPVGSDWLARLAAIHRTTSPRPSYPQPERLPYWRLAATVIALDGVGVSTMLAGLVLWSGTLAVAGMGMVVASYVALCLGIAGRLGRLGIEGIGSPEGLAVA